MTDTKESAAERAAVVIPGNWREMGWPDLRSLASKLTDEPVRNKDEAVAAVEAEAARRAGTPATEPTPLADVAPQTKVVDLPKRPGADVEIPRGWHDKMSVADIVALARKIDPEGNPVDVIRAEEARRTAA